MVHATTASHNRRNYHPTLRGWNNGSNGATSRMISRLLRPRIILAILVGTVPLYLIRIESIIYRELRSYTQGEEEDTVVGNALRHSTISTNNNNQNDSDRPKQTLIPVSRNGFLSRGSLRSPIVAPPNLAFDYLDIELMKDQNILAKSPQQESHKENQLETKRKHFPRTIALNENMGVTGMADGIFSPIETARTMELEEVPMNDDENVGSILDFELPFYNDCDRVLKKLPTVHPTCNSVHELLLTTSETDSVLLSMKGSWRSVWKVDFDHRNRNQMLNSTDKFDINETTYSLSAKETTENDQVMPQSSSASVVLKMLHLHRQFDHHSFEAHSMDIMVMDRLTASPYVVNSYGFCGQSVVTEFAASTGRDYVKRYDIKNRERLKIARDLARGLVDVQALEVIPHDKIVLNSTLDGAYDETLNVPVVFAHNDINIANTVMINGRIKLNDFNIGVFMRKERNQPDSRLDSSQGRHHRPPIGKGNQINSSSESVSNGYYPSTSTTPSFIAFTEKKRDKIRHLCPAPVIYRSDMWRSPEEIANITYVQVTQADIYGLGNILYQTMTRHQPWTYKEPGGALTKTDIANRKLNGMIPTIPEQYLNTTKRELQTMFVATNMCFFPIPEQRPTARRLAFGLGSLYEMIKQKKRVTRKLILEYLAPSRT